MTRNAPIRKLLPLALAVAGVAAAAQPRTPVQVRAPSVDGGDEDPWYLCWFRDLNNNRIDDEIEDFEIGAPMRVDFMVTFERAAYAADRDSLVAELDAIAAPFGGHVEQAFEILPSVLVVGTELNYPLWDNFFNTYLDPFFINLFMVPMPLPVVMVESIHQSGPGAAVAPCSTTLSDPLFDSDFLADSNVLPAVWDTTGGEWPCGTSGLSTTVAIVDAGVDGYGSIDPLKLAGGYDAVAGMELDPADQTGPTGADNLWHGTRVGHVAMGLDRAYGVAPFAALIDVNIAYAHTDTLPEGHTTSDRILAAFDWLLAHKDDTWSPIGAPSIDIGRIDAVNVSYTDHGPIAVRFLPIPTSPGAPMGLSDGSDLLSRAVDSLVVNGGMPVVVGAGNDGEAGAGFGGLAAAANAITVGAYDSAEPDSSVAWSNHGVGIYGVVKPDLVGSGVDIYTGGAKGSGTSFAAPQVAGAVALMRSAHPTATPAELARALRDSAVPPEGSSGYHSYFGYGRLDVEGALAVIDTLVGGGAP